MAEGRGRERVREGEGEGRMKDGGGGGGWRRLGDFGYDLVGLWWCWILPV